MDSIDESVKDYKAAGTDSSLVLGDWEQTFNIKDRLWLCKSLSGQLSTINFSVKPKLVTVSPVNYIIGSGPFNIQWDNTWVSDTGCNVLLQKFVADESTSSG